jgi:hypothetical protein
MSNPRHNIYIYLFIYFRTGTCINHDLGPVLVLGLVLAKGWFPIQILFLENIQNFEPVVQIPGNGN